MDDHECFFCGVLGSYDDIRVHIEIDHLTEPELLAKIPWHEFIILTPEID